MASALFSACVSEITAPCSSSLSRTTPCSSSRPPAPFLSSGAGLPVIVVNSPIGRGVDEEPPCGLPRGVPLLPPYPPDMAHGKSQSDCPLTHDQVNSSSAPALGFKPCFYRHLDATPAKMFFKRGSRPNRLSGKGGPFQKNLGRAQARLGTGRGGPIQKNNPGWDDSTPSSCPLEVQRAAALEQSARWTRQRSCTPLHAPGRGFPGQVKKRRREGNGPMRG